MRKNNLLLILFVAFFLIGIISAYTYSSPSYSQFNHAGGLGGFASYSSGTIDKELCSAGTDFILQMNPLDCEPAPVRSDLLEEEDVTVYCKLVATQINPLIDVEAIRYISVNGEYPSEVRSVGYFPSQSALGYTSENVLGDVALNDMGYVAITLKQNSNESSLTNCMDSKFLGLDLKGIFGEVCVVEGNLTAKIRYDAENAFGVGQAEFYLPVLSDEEFNERILQYSFWEGRGYLRAESVGDDNAIIGIYSDVNSAGNFGADKQRVNRVALERGQTSGEMYIPGFSPCLASLKVRLNGLEDPDTTARLKINSDYIELTERSTFLEGNCRVTDIRKDGLNQKVSISCREDDDNSNFDLRISPSVKLKVGDADLQDYSVGDFLYRAEDNTKSVYLGYIGSKGDTERLEDLYVALIAIPEDKDELSESEISSIATQMNMLFSDVTTGSSVVDVSANVLKKFSGGILTGMKWAVDGNDLHVVDLKGSSGVISAKEDFKGETVSLAGFSEAQDSNFVSVEEEIYTLQKTKIGSPIQQDAYKIINSNKEETGLYLLISDSGIPKMILSSDAILGMATFGYFYGKDCTKHEDCEQYLLSSNDLKPADAYSEFFENLIYGEVNPKDNKLVVRKVSFDSVSDEEYYKYYSYAMSDYETIISSFSGEDYDSKITYGEESLYQAILLSEKIGQRKTMKDLCIEFEESYPDSKKQMEICEDVYKISNSGINSREVLVNGQVKDISFDGIYQPSYEDYGAEIIVRGPNGKAQTYQLKKDEIVYLSGLRSGSATEEMTIYTLDDKTTKKVYFKYINGWQWSTDKSNWKTDVPEVGSSIVSDDNRKIIEKLKDYNFADGDALLTGGIYKATTEVVAFTEYIKLSSVDEDSAKVFINVESESGYSRLLSTNTYTLQKGESPTFGSQYSFTLNDVNLKKSARVSVIPSFNYQESNTTFSFKVGIEKRAIQLSDEKIDSTIKKLNKSIEDWNKISDGLNTFNEALGKTCLATGAVLTVKNFIQNSDGKAIARQEVMQGSGGWNEFCEKEVAKDNSEYSSLDDCFFDNANKIDERVDEVYQAMKSQDEKINAIEASTEKTNFNTIDEDSFVKTYSKQVVNSLNGIGQGGSLSNPSGSGDSINIKEMQNEVLDENGWDAGDYSIEQLREIELYANLVKSADNSEDKEFYEERLYSVLTDVKVNAVASVKRDSLSDKYGVNVDLFELNSKDTIKRAYLGGTYGKLDSSVKSKIKGYNDDDPVQVVYTSEGDEYIFFLEDQGESILPVRKNEEGKKLVYDSSGVLVDENDLSDFKRIYFVKYDKESYENKYENAEVKYYEEEPYAGYPAVVPLDTKNGWYAGVKPKLDIGSSIAAYDDSGRVNSFWLCNVGENGLEEFSKDSFGDDICQQINVGNSGTVYNQFYGLEESETTRLVNNAVTSIEEAQRAYKNGAKRVRINGQNFDVGEPAVRTSAVSCTDYMSPKDCQILFNVCDPVVCPSSRCDFGGDYPVKDVVQSGVIGSIALCAPNAKEGILVPVCTTGVQAGIDSWLSVQEAYRDCLQENLETGKTIGICDEIHSVYVCEFFWRQTLPIAKLAVPKILNKIAGEGIRGGGEYLGLQSSWENARDSLNYFTQYYASESYTAFKLRSVDEAGGEVCKNFASVVYPSGGELLDSLTTPRSPPQFSGNFDEIKMTTITNPPTSHYKVYYRVYAGKDSGAYYQVYLTGGSSSSYYQDTAVRRVVDSGYVTVGDTAVETIDFQAPSGYTTMCMVVNGQEECGFAKVSTSFAVNYVNDLYLAEQTTTKVKTEEECVSGTASLYSLLNPNAESIVDELINPALYQKGIIRICATDNPGVGTDGKVGTENERWRDVGYCGNENIRCWIDTDSVKEVIKSMNIEEEALNETAQGHINSLIASGNYVSNENYTKKISEINSESNAYNKINLINEILDKVYFSNQKAQLYLLRGLAYGMLSTEEYAKVEEFQSDYFYNIEEILGEETSIPEGLEELAQKIASYAGYYVSEKQACSIQGGYNSANCYNSITLIYGKIGVKEPTCMYSSKKTDKLPSGIKVFDETDTFKYDCAGTGSLSESEKLGLLKPGYQFDAIITYSSGTDGVGSPNYAAHSMIFLEWADINKNVAKVFDWNGQTYEVGKTNSKNEVCEGEFIHTFSSGSKRCKTYQIVEKDLSDSVNYIYLIRGYPSGNVIQAETSEEINWIDSETTYGDLTKLTEDQKKIYDKAKECVDCITPSPNFFGNNKCDENLCLALRDKLGKWCEPILGGYSCTERSPPGAGGSWGDDISEDLTDKQEKILEDAYDCRNCEDKGSTNCDEKLCAAISEKINENCIYKETGGFNCVKDKTDYEVSYNDPEYYENQWKTYDDVQLGMFTTNEREVFLDADECSDCGGNLIDTNFCDDRECYVIGLKINKNCEYKSSSCKETIN